MSNIYHILHKEPALTKKNMPPLLEEYVEKLFASGRIRIDAEDKINFVRYTAPEIGATMMFSNRELYDEALLPRTLSILEAVISHKHPRRGLKKRVNEALEYLRKNDKKYFPVEEELEKKLIRVIAQSTEPEVLDLLLLEQTEVFITYDYMVGGMLDVITWQSAGDSGGLQSSNTKDSAVFISTAGDPFAKVPKENKEDTFGPGKPALARMMVIGAQELGHYADLIRSPNGRKMDRVSANFQATRAKPDVARARHLDLQHIASLTHHLNQYGLQEAVRLEKARKFYKKHKKRTTSVVATSIKSRYKTNSLLQKIEKIDPAISHKFGKEKYPADQLLTSIRDMKFNLAPEADAYRRDDPNEKEAIDCVEALARVPQQVVKWGHDTTNALMPNLYYIYYQKVIPECRKGIDRLKKRKSWGWN